MIDPRDVTKFDRTVAELQEWWLFSTIVAGKTAATQARLLDMFLKEAARDEDAEPFDTIARLIEATRRLKVDKNINCDCLRFFMSKASLGQYGRLTKCWEQSLTLDLRNDPVEAFEAVHGVGPKTARMFLMHSRPNQRFAAIDTHVLKHLAAKGIQDVPRATPPGGRRYRELELAFLDLADASGMSVAEYDLEVWKSYAKNPQL